MKLLQGALARPLPPKWDDHVVEWDALTEQIPTTLDWHMTKAQQRAAVCAKCGAPDREALHAVGTVHPLAGETFDGTRTKRLRSGRSYGVPTKVPAWPLRSLVAFRCRTCGLDTVWDTQTEEWWELDEADYGADGSTDPQLF